MCPNCFPKDQLIIQGWLLAFAICFVFFAVALGVMYFASKSGHLDDLDDIKYRILED